MSIPDWKIFRRRRRFCAVQVFSPKAKTLAQGEFTSPEHLKSPEGGAGFWPAEPKQKDTLFSVSFCLKLDFDLDIFSSDLITTS